MGAEKLTPRKIAVLTVGRSDFGRYRPVLSALKDDPSVELRLLAGGRHFDPRFGDTHQEITECGFDWVAGLGVTLDADTAAAVGLAIAEGTRLLSNYFARERPDLLVVLGDRYEMISGINAALGFNLPVAHIHGGAVTEGAIDELVRHAMTKMSHLHLTSCEPYAERLRQMGEEDWRVHVTGAPGLDDLAHFAGRPKAEISKAVGLDLTAPTLLVCFHPVTVEAERTGQRVAALIDALDRNTCQIILTYPNADHGSQLIIDAFENFAGQNSNRVRLVRNAGTRLFTGLLANVSAMVGNSSSAIVEAPSFRLPAVDLGDRQRGKLKAANIISCGHAADDIAAAIRRAMTPEFRAGLDGLVNPYGDAKSGPRIGALLASVVLDHRLLRKRFIDR